MRKCCSGKSAFSRAGDLVLDLWIGQNERRWQQLITVLIIFCKKLRLTTWIQCQKDELHRFVDYIPLQFDTVITMKIKQLINLFVAIRSCNTGCQRWSRRGFEQNAPTFEISW